MYGLVNTAIKDMVEEKFGEQAWRDLSSKTGCPFDFSRMEQYPDSITYGLVVEAAAKLGVSEADVLREFGRFWVGYVAKAYGELFAISGNGTLEFLRNLNSLHARVSAQMPGLRPPAFVVRGSGSDFEVEYHSERKGLHPMIPGLLEGLGTHFGERVESERTGGGEGFDVFAVRVSTVGGADA